MATLALMLLVLGPAQSEATPQEAEIRALLRKLEGATDLYPGYEIAMTLAKFGEPAVPLLGEGLQSKDAGVRMWSARTLTNMGREKTSAAGPALLQALEKEDHPRAFWYLAQAVGVVRPDPERSVALLARRVDSKDDEIRGSAADALAEFGSAAKTVKPSLIRALGVSGPGAQWRLLFALQRIGLEKADLEGLKDLRLAPESRCDRDVLVELFAHPEAAITFVRGNPRALASFQKNDSALVELFSRSGDARDALRRFLLEQKNLPEFVRVDRAKAESWGVVMVWPRNQDPKECFPQRDWVVKIVGTRALVESLKQHPDYKLWVKEGTALLRIGNKYGYIEEDGTIAIAPAFDQARHFAGGVAPVVVGNKYGYIDRKGKYIVEPKFEWAYEFTQGLGAVKLDQKWGLVNAKGVWVKPPVYERIAPLTGGLYAESGDGRKGFLDENGEFKP